jgi:DNA-binding SARP family transcriptional activator/Tfp pilus assembly protein PilF
VRFVILGAVEVCVDGERLPTIAPRHRAVLAYLLLHPRTVVSISRLTDAMWGPSPPQTAPSQIHAAVTAIRRMLRAAGVAEILETHRAGYVIIPEHGQLDLDDFNQLVVSAQRAADAGRTTKAAQELRGAIALWGGEPLGGATADYVPSARARLDERRLAAFERLAELELAQGQNDDIAHELAAELAQYPLRERLCRQLMLALHRAGRQSEALAAARRFRSTLVEQQGLDPTREFFTLEHAILRNDPSLHLPTMPRAITASAPARLPEQERSLHGRNFLPYDIPDFAGRAAELHRLMRPADGTAATVFAIDGMAGAGKTAMAVRAAHQLVEDFPDGQLFVDLHAFTARKDPMDAASALEILLGQLGVLPEQIPASSSERAARWRMELHDRNVLVVLDNARDAEHVRPLLAGSTGSRVLITSRHRLIDLDGADTISLEPLPRDDAIELFTNVVGERASAEPLAALDVLEACGFLPLAVRIAAARLRHRPRWPVDYLASRLRDERRILTELATAERGVAAAFTVSYEQLGPGQQRMFRLLGLHPGRDVDVSAAAAMANVPIDAAETMLEGLLDAHMLLQHEPGRYTFHDLLREHARATAESPETGNDGSDAIARLLDHYLYTASAAIGLIHPDQDRPRVLGPPTPAVCIDGVSEAATWLDAECANLVAVGLYAAGHDLGAYTVRLADTLYRYLHRGSHHGDAIALHDRALRISQRDNDTDGEARAHIHLGELSDSQGHYAQAQEHYGRALDLYRQIGETAGEARALNRLGLVSWWQRNYGQAQEHLRLSLDRHRESGDQVGEAAALGNLGLLHYTRGAHELALDQFTQALSLFRELGSRDGEATALDKLGLVYEQLEKYDEAREHHRQAADLFRVLGDRRGEADAHNGLGEAARAMSDPVLAVDDHTAALVLANEIGNGPEQGRAHDGLARAHHSLGRIDLAREHAERALAVYADLGVPESDDVRAFLTSLE